VFAKGIVPRAEQPLALEAGDTAVARVDPDNVVLTVFA
jgi:hypothetical protein